MFSSCSVAYRLTWGPYNYAHNVLGASTYSIYPSQYTSSINIGTITVFIAPTPRISCCLDTTSFFLLTVVYDGISYFFIQRNDAGEIRSHICPMYLSGQNWQDSELLLPLSYFLLDFYKSYLVGMLYDGWKL